MSGSTRIAQLVVSEREAREAGGATSCMATGGVAQPENQTAPESKSIATVRGPLSRIPSCLNHALKNIHNCRFINVDFETGLRVVLKDEGGDGSTYSEEEKDAFIWYSYLFLGKGKPTTHLLALNRIKTAQLTKSLPPVLTRLVNAIRSKLRANEPLD